LKGGVILGAVGWLSVGFLVCFFFNRLFDSISKNHAKEFKYNCSECKYPCTGKHCYEMRLALENRVNGEGEENAVLNEIPEDSN